MPLDSLDKSPSAAAADDDLPPPTQPPPSRRRDRRDDRDFDRPPYRRDYGDRSSPPPPPLRDRDRDRDYKRRRSPSSPPYRERRYSPQSFKRSRRVSPRGGYGPDDRFGYDNNGGYERGVGGRSGYADEKSHGRFNRSMGGYHHGPTDAGFNRGGYADSSNRGNTQREGLMSYKQFIQELEDDVLPSEAERRYQEYRSEYISTQKRTFFTAHKGEEWLKNKYHPTNLVGVIERRNEHARQVAKDLLLDLQSGTLDLNPGVTASSSSKLGQASEPNSDDEAADAGGKRKQHGRGRADDIDFSAAPKAHAISSEPRRIDADINQALALLRKLDDEKGIKDHILKNVDYDSEKPHGGSGQIVIIRGLTSVKGLEGTELLDTLITYLWRVHGLDYYGMVESNEPKGFRHVRPDGKNHGETNESGAEWEKKLDSFWEERLQGQDFLEVMSAKEKIEAAANEVLDPYVRKIRDEKYGWKYGCGAKSCTKLFHAAEFVHKHLKLKHPEVVMELTSKMRDDLYFQNYMNDPDAPGGKPVMQQTFQKDRPQKRRLGIESRLKDDRHLRTVDGVNDGERFNNSESSPSRQSKAGGVEMGNQDESMYDAYGGQGMGAPFASDMPSVLMPVPGAGPLGPFVPAPPEVAMQMLRDQPSVYDASGRQMRSGAQIGGPAPILTVPPFRQDPRQMRSYQDLDAPDDEVTVIDYRSL